MNWEYTGVKSYVDVIPPTQIFPPNTTYERPPFWSTPQADARLKPGILRQPCSSEHLRGGVQPFGATSAQGLGQTRSTSVLPSQRVPLLRTSSLPPVDPSRQLSSTPELHQSTFSPSSSQNTPALSQSAFTPPNSATASVQPQPQPPPPPHIQIQPQPQYQPPLQPPVNLQNPNMTDPRRTQGHQRPAMGPPMGPPETPSRVMQASPSMFPTLQFSPDLFSGQSMGPATAPVYPQQRLFWDQTPNNSDPHLMNQYNNPYQDGYDASFHSSSTIVPNYSPVVSQESAFDLPQPPTPAGPFLDTTTFPMPFQTSPRPPPPTIENPTQFLSSPARRFGGSDIPVTSSFMRPAREVPAYHHQIEESRREREIERKRNRNAAKKADADLIMSSVKRALSPSKQARPGMKRSLTYSGVSTHQQPRRSSRASINDSASASSIASAGSSRRGRSSPLKSMRQSSASSLLVSKTRSSQKSRTALSLAIDENGVARTVLQQLPESNEGLEADEDEQSVLSSTDEEDLSVLRSQNTSFVFNDDDDDETNGPLDTSRTLGRTSSQDNRFVSSQSNARSSRRGTSQTEVNTVGKGDAQKALRAIIEDRTRSASIQGAGYSSSRQSDSSVQFHSSPPVQQNQFGDFNASPTTITDPDLATPSTDQETFATLGATRCICNSASPDGSAMIQCDSCSKWLHANCVGFDKRRPSDIYICVYCEQTPVRHPSSRGTVRSSMRGTGNSASPLAHKSVRPNRTR